MAHPAGGYREALPPADARAPGSPHAPLSPLQQAPAEARALDPFAAAPRRQNPHMHLLEALLAAHTAFGDPVFLDRAHALVGLFTDRLLDPATGALPEFYDDALQPLTTGGVFETEPGHHCEWAWLLHEYAHHAGPDPRRAASAARLLAFADAHGTHPATHDLIDSVASNGAPLARSARLWPQAERLKTAFLRPGRTPAHQQVVLASLSAYLRPDGLWHERRDPDGVFIAGPAPASSLYHLSTAILTASAAASSQLPD
jgi:mannose-6-phosphate isomerase